MLRVTLLASGFIIGAHFHRLALQYFTWCMLYQSPEYCPL